MVERMGTTDVPEVVQAKAFQLLDDNGNVRAELAMDDDNPYLAMSDPNGLWTLITQVYEFIPMLTLQDRDGNLRLSAQVNESGPVLILHGQDQGPPG